jgi:hypothetical protein
MDHLSKQFRDIRSGIEALQGAGIGLTVCGQEVLYKESVVGTLRPDSQGVYFNLTQPNLLMPSDTVTLQRALKQYDASRQASRQI